MYVAVFMCESKKKEGDPMKKILKRALALLLAFTLLFGAQATGIPSSAQETNFEVEPQDVIEA